MLFFFKYLLTLFVWFKSLVAAVAQSLHILPNKAQHFEKYVVIQYLDGNAIETLLIPKDPDQTYSVFTVNAETESGTKSEKYPQPIGIPILVAPEHFVTKGVSAKDIAIVAGFDE